MGAAVSLDATFVGLARSYGAAQSRSAPKQIEHWAKIGQIAEENPELSYSDIQEILLGIEDVKAGRVYSSEEVRKNLGLDD